MNELGRWYPTGALLFALGDVHTALLRAIAN